MTSGILVNGVGIGTLPPALQALLIAEEFLRSSRTVLWLVQNEDAMYRAAEDLACFIDPSAVHCFHPLDVRPYQGDSPSREIISARIAVLKRLLGRQAMIVVAPSEAVLPYTLPPESLDEAVIRIETGQDLNREELAARLVRMGYTREPLVDDVGQFSMRGFVMDIFSPGMQDPARIEMFGSTIEQIKTFTISSQRSRSHLTGFDILPVSEVLLESRYVRQARPRLRRMKGENIQVMIQDLEQGILTPGIENYLPAFYEEQASLFDYLPRDYLLVSPDSVDMAEDWDQVSGRHAAAYTRVEDAALKPEELLLPRDMWHALARNGRHVSTSLSGGQAPVDWKEVHLGRGAEAVLDQIEVLRGEGFAVFIFIGSSMLKERIIYALSQRRIEARSADVFDARARPGVTIVQTPISSGFILPGRGLAIITGDEAFGGRKHHKPAKRQPILNPFTQLNVGDAVVHRDNGIGIFKGIERIELDGLRNDFVVLEYLGGDKLYVPVYRLGLLQRYIGDADAMIIDRLGGTRWVKAKAHARESARKMAGELLAIYAKRESAHGFSYDVAHASIKEFEDDFPYDETEDQLKTIEDMYADMASRRPMDRLVCGDVGYGKTEVALRSAFVAAMNGKQAAILVPTTLLARQHLATFRTRFERWPLRVEGLSSFGGSQANKAVLEDVAKGKVDVVIGTQTLLSSTVRFKDLGLLVIDEEHRFGVKDKEKIKGLRAEIDILTLTATPIPRTLNMAISGIRDMSIIETPPVDRKSIETVISRFDDDTIMQAAQREFARGGQVFFVHNQVANIEEMADYIRSICPHARVGVAHGQMSRRELEKIMEQFLDRRINLLVSSAIIGSGIDISTANTIIIDRADKFGLADLYQLRGRVGRSKIKGFALLLIPAVGQISKDAHKRLSAIKEYESLGAGFQMALRDMEIRGVGDILGHAQWGQVTAIGFELYQQMLKEAVDKLRGVQTVPEFDPEIRIDLDAYIPDEYCPDQHMRLGIYKRLSTAGPEEIMAIHDELVDMFGPLPGPLKTLLNIAEIRDLMRGVRIRKLEWEDALLKLYFAHDTMVNIEALVDLVTKNGGRMAPEGLAELKVRKVEGVLAILHGLNDQNKR